jgi:hypothetical protein
MNQATALKRISEVSATDNGRGIAFRVETANGKTLDVSMPTDQLHKLIEDFVNMAQQAAMARTKGIPVPLSVGPPTIFSSNDATAIGIGEAVDGKTMFLIVRLHDFDLTFRIGRSTLPGLADSFSQAAAAVDAEENRQQ